jgi:hypothetical protein
LYISSAEVLLNQLLVHEYVVTSIGYHHFKLTITFMC